MKLSKRTLRILKNFSELNTNLLIAKNTNEIGSINTLRSVYSMNVIDEKFENEVSIYDTKEFLKMYNSLVDPEITKVDDKFMHIKSKDVSLKYPMSDKSTIVHPTKSVSMPNKTNYTFKLSKEVLTRILKLAKIRYLNDVLFYADSKTLTVSVLDNSWTGSGEISFLIGKTKDHYRSFHKVDNLSNLLLVDYDVTISSQSITMFKNDNEKITTYIAQEPSSTYLDDANFKKAIKKKHKVEIQLAKLTSEFNKQEAKLLKLLPKVA